MTSLIVAGDHLLSVNTPGVAFCYDAATGTVFCQEKLGRHHVSPILVGGPVYFINDDGQVNAIVGPLPTLAAHFWVTNASRTPTRVVPLS